MLYEVITVPSRPASFSLEVKKSRFLAEVFPVSSQEEARALIKSQKERYADARHVVHAFAVGESGGILGCSDDGEPSGTAGRPVITSYSIHYTKLYDSSLPS